MADFISDTNRRAARSSYAGDSTVSSVSDAIVNNQEQKIVEALKRVNSKVGNIAIANNRVFIDIGLPQKMPLYAAGGGIREILLTLGALSAPDTHILLQDEIGKMLYFASQTEYLRAVLRFAKTQNKQIFATTHSKDVLIALKNVAEQEEDLRDEVMCYSMLRDRRKKMWVYPYAYGDIENCINNDAEIR